ncbi:unnamed protein product [Closterium sp. Yama58-4]|nr:unnamed protein product [Closterium sp. Yama58-4]
MEDERKRDGDAEEGEAHVDVDAGTGAAGRGGGGSRKRKQAQGARKKGGGEKVPALVKWGGRAAVVVGGGAMAAAAAGSSLLEYQVQAVLRGAHVDLAAARQRGKGNKPPARCHCIVTWLYLCAHTCNCPSSPSSSCQVQAVLRDAHVDLAAARQRGKGNKPPARCHCIVTWLYLCAHTCNCPSSPSSSCQVQAVLRDAHVDLAAARQRGKGNKPPARCHCIVTWLYLCAHTCNCPSSPSSSCQVQAVLRDAHVDLAAARQRGKGVVVAVDSAVETLRETLKAMPEGEQGAGAQGRARAHAPIRFSPSRGGHEGPVRRARAPSAIRSFPPPPHHLTPPHPAPPHRRRATAYAPIRFSPPPPPHSVPHLSSPCHMQVTADTSLPYVEALVGAEGVRSLAFTFHRPSHVHAIGSFAHHSASHPASHTHGGTDGGGDGGEGGEIGEGGASDGFRGDARVRCAAHACTDASPGSDGDANSSFTMSANSIHTS